MKWLRLDAVLAMHKRQIAEHGGSDGVRDLGLLESALARPLDLAALETDADIAALAATYAFGIMSEPRAVATGLPFNSSNKRTALVAMRTFLLLNGHTLTATPEDKYLTILTLASGDLSEEDLAQWLRDHIG